MSESKLQIKNYVTPEQIQQAVTLSLAIAGDDKQDGAVRARALSCVFKGYHASITDMLNERLLELHAQEDEAKDELNKTSKKALTIIEKMAKKDRKPWEDDYDTEED